MPPSAPPRDPSSDAAPGTGTAYPDPAHRLDPALLGDVDAWDLCREGDFYAFHARLPGAEGGRRYFRPVTGGAVMAETSGPVLALMGLGGGRLGTTWPGAPRFAHHVVACTPPEGDEPDRIATGLRNRSGESELADRLIGARHAAFRALPLIVAGRALLAPGGTDADALDALVTQYDRAGALARAFGRNLRMLALRIDPGFDQAPEEAGAFHARMLGLLDAVTARLGPRDTGTLRFLLSPDCGAWWQHDAAANRPALEGLHRLMLRPGLHRIIAAAPGYCFALDDLGQPTEAAMADRAALEAEALETALARKEWLCPLMCLAERSGDTIRATFRSLSPLVLDAADPFGAGATAGFALAGTAAQIAAVAIAPDDPGAVLIRTSGDLGPRRTGETLRLDYAIGGAARPPSGHPPACGALRDDWHGAAPSGGRLHRWALPASIIVREGYPMRRPPLAQEM